MMSLVVTDVFVFPTGCLEWNLGSNCVSFCMLQTPAFLKQRPSGHLVPKLRCIDVDATSSRRIDGNATSFLRFVPAVSMY